MRTSWCDWTRMERPRRMSRWILWGKILVLCFIVVQSFTGRESCNRIATKHFLSKRTFKIRSDKQCKGHYAGGSFGPPRFPSDRSLFVTYEDDDSNSDRRNTSTSNNNWKIFIDNRSKDLTISSFIQKWQSISQETRKEIIFFAKSLVIAQFLRWFFFEPRYIPSLSMFPTFHIGDHLLIDKISSWFRPYQRRDVVIFDPPDSFIAMTGARKSDTLIKRIIAMAGDAVVVKNRRVYVNDILQEENYLNDLPDYDFEVEEIPEGYVLVLGDNRNHSLDSHIWGLLPAKNIIGRAVLKYWPPRRVGFIEGSL